MDIFDTPEMAMLRETAARFVADNAGETDAGRLWARFLDLGWFGLDLPEEKGGCGLGPAAAVAVMEAMGRGALASPYLAGSLFAGGILSRCADAGEALDGLLRGRLRVAVQASLALPPHDVAATEIAAAGDGSSLRLDGEALLVGWARTDAALVAAAAGERDGPALLLLLPVADMAGATVEPLAFADGGEGARLVLRDAAVPRGAALAGGDEGRAILDAARTGALLAAAADNLGAMQGLFDATLAYVKLRRQFGRAIGSFQALQFRLTDMWIKLDEARSLVMAATTALAHGEADAARLVAAAWIQGLWSGRMIAEEAVQMHGAIGMTQECAVGRAFRRMLVNETIFGGEDVHLRAYDRLTPAPAAPEASAATA